MENTVISNDSTNNMDNEGTESNGQSAVNTDKSDSQLSMHEIFEKKFGDKTKKEKTNQLKDKKLSIVITQKQYDYLEQALLYEIFEDCKTKSDVIRYFIDEGIKDLYGE